MEIHRLKTVQPWFDFVWDGAKLFEIRFNDRNFQPGDWLVLEEFEPPDRYGRRVGVIVKEVLREVPGPKDAFVLLLLYPQRIKQEVKNG